MLLGFLDLYRATIVRKAEGLSDERAKWSPVASGTSLFGIVSHLTYAERFWFSQVVAGLDVELPWDDDDPDADPDVDWRGAPGATLADVVRGYEEEGARSRAILEAADFEQLCDTGESHVSVRWVALHLLEEIARHAGHADIIREQLDRLGTG